MTTETFLDILTRKPRNIAVLTNPDHGLYLQHSELPEPGRVNIWYTYVRLVFVDLTYIFGSMATQVSWWFGKRTGLVIKAQA